MRGSSTIAQIQRRRVDVVQKALDRPHSASTSRARIKHKISTTAASISNANQSELKRHEHFRDSTRSLALVRADTCTSDLAIVPKVSRRVIIIWRCLQREVALTQL